MTNVDRIPATDELICGVLEGGPSGLPESLRIRREPADEPVIKVRYLGGYEHFERVEGEGTPIVYRWVTRTRIAE
jgi:Family of unknown function (DUF5988)